MNVKFKKERTIRAVLFDMDGVIVDSEIYINRAGVEMFREKGYRVDPEDFLQFTGMGENRYLGGVAELHGIPFNEAEDKARTYEMYAGMVEDSLSPLKGVIAFIKKCKKRGLLLALASSADPVKININLNEIGIEPGTFDTIVSGLDIAHKKPAPDIFLKASERLNVPIDSCLVVEDAVSGVKAGKAAGARVLALTTSFSKTDLKEADWIASTLADAGEEVLRW